MASSVELAELKSNKIASAKALLDQADGENRELTGEEYETYQAHLKEIDDLGNQITKLSRRETIQELEAQQKEIKPHFRKTVSQNFDAREYQRVWHAWASGKTSDAELYHRCAEFGLPVKAKEVELFTTPLYTGGTNAGAEWLARTFVAQLDQAISSYCPLASVVHSFQTSNGEPYDFPSGDDTNNKAVVVNQHADVTGEALPITDSVQSTVTKYRTGVVPVTQEELEDSRIDIPTYLAAAFGERFGRAYCDDGTEVLVNGANVGGALDTGDDLTIGKLYDYYFSLDQGYTNSPKYFNMMAAETWAQVCQMEDGDGRLLWPNINDQPVRRLLGAQVILNNSMPGLVTGSPGDTIMLLGDFDKFWFRKGGSTRLKRYEEMANMANLDTVGFQAFERVGWFYRGTANAILSLNKYNASSLFAN